MSGYCRALLLRSMFGQTSNMDLSLPAQGWIALARSPVGAETAGWAMDEPPDTITDASGAVLSTNYSRARIGLGINSNSWQDSGLSGVVNSVDVVFNRATASWGTLKFWAMLDEEHGGRILVYGSLAQKYVVQSGDTVIVAPGAMRIGLDSYDMEW